jgi:hypothetical protein
MTKKPSGSCPKCGEPAVRLADRQESFDDTRYEFECKNGHRWELVVPGKPDGDAQGGKYVS